MDINKYWDRISKVLILLVDAGLNWYFLKIVKDRLLSRNGLVKYKPLVAFNAKLMVVSIAMDVCGITPRLFRIPINTRLTGLQALLIGLMSYPNQLVFTQFHPVTYMVKLNIEMSMASLIAHLAASQSTQAFSSYSDPHGDLSHPAPRTGTLNRGANPESRHGESIELGLSSDEDLRKTHNGKAGIHKRVDVEVRFDSSKSVKSSEERLNDEGLGARYYSGDDEVALTNEVGALTSRRMPRTTWDSTAVGGSRGRGRD